MAPDLRVDMRRADVAIVGCGPVGAMLGVLLGAHGVRTVILERQIQAYGLPRAVHFDDEIMRCFQAVGLAQQMADITRFNPGMRFADDTGRILLDWPRPPAITDQGWRSSYRFHQPALEAVLRGALRRYDPVTLLEGAEVRGLRPSREGVSLSVARNGAVEEIEAQFVVGCDGARSTVRTAIGGGHEDLGFDERWLVVDLVLRRARPDLGDYTVQHCDAASPATYVRGVGDRRRWEFRLSPGEADDALADNAVWARLAKWATPDDADLERAAIYTFRSRIANKWRRGRLLIAGDAAHETPPFMGQGMCAGIRDAANLAWKLATVLRTGDDALLDSYEAERAPNVREYIDLTVSLGRLINRTAEAVQAAEPGAGLAPPSLSTPRPRLGGPAGRHDLIGELAPQFRIGDGLSDARTPLGAMVLVASGSPAKAETIAVVRGEEADGLDEWLRQSGVVAVLVRPDRYVQEVAVDEGEIAALSQRALFFA